jgi:hypothetical protein
MVSATAEDDSVQSVCMHINSSERVRADMTNEETRIANS